jgi:hypothetical protein
MARRRKAAPPSDRSVDTGTRTSLPSMRGVPMTPAHALRARPEEFLRHLARRGFDVRPLVFERPATEVQIETLENKLGYRLPGSFRRALRDISARVDFRWFAPGDLDFPEPFKSTFSGHLHWSVVGVDAATGGSQEGLDREGIPRSRRPVRRCLAQQAGAVRGWKRRPDRDRPGSRQARGDHRPESRRRRRSRLGPGRELRIAAGALGSTGLPWW